MGFAKLDSDREDRTGFPEVVFCQGKKDAFLVEIYKKIYESNGRVLGTRATIEQYEVVKEVLPQVTYDEVSRILKIDGTQKSELSSKESGSSGNSRISGDENADEQSAGIGEIAVCSAGTADIPVAEEAAQTAEFFGSHVERYYDIGVSGIHRLLDRIDDIKRANCVIAVAGMEGALASVLGGQVSNPVIAVPTSVGYGAGLGGLSALLTMINSCANGVSVVNIDNGYGAGYIATQINRLATR
ncbi:MAG: nickel pincer cofactor biosynthesis protein LarB [Eubacterium sp.]|nr:nickel pincer cofactor biosynthesis protein LarB [Eubacterium sp.]